MLDFLEEIKAEAEVSKREVILCAVCAFLGGLVIGLLIGSSKSRPKPPKQIIIKEEKPEAHKVLAREDYE